MTCEGWTICRAPVRLEFVETFIERPLGKVLAQLGNLLGMFLTVRYAALVQLPTFVGLVKTPVVNSFVKEAGNFAG